MKYIENILLYLQYSRQTNNKNLAKLMNSKILYLFLVFLFFSANVFAQAKIEFEVSTHDFGKIPEGTLANYEFKFKNTGTEPLILSSVRASCGCTTPNWTKEPVMPGKEGIITASYNSKGRPGAFNKSITIQSNSGSNGNMVIYVKGVVIPKESVERVYTEEEKAMSAKLDVDKKLLQAGKIEKSQSVPLKINVLNNGKSDLIVSGLKSNCNCVALDDKNSIKTIQPGKSGNISIIYSPRSIGKFNEVITILSNDILNPEYKVTIQCEVVESLSNDSMLKEGGNAFKF
jgi:hypothetical protein